MPSKMLNAICMYVLCMYACVLSCFSRIQLFVTLWTVAHQAPLSKVFSKQEYWCGLPCPPPGVLPNLEIKLSSVPSPAFPGGFFTTSVTSEVFINLFIPASLVAQLVKNLPAIQETWVQSVGWKDPLEKG